MSIANYCARDPRYREFIDAVVLAARENDLVAAAGSWPVSPFRFYLSVKVSDLDDAASFVRDLAEIVARDPNLDVVGSPKALVDHARGGALVALYWPTVELYSTQPWGRA